MVPNHGRVTLKRQRLHQDDLSEDRTLSKSCTVYPRNTSVKHMLDDDALALRRLVMACAEHAVCGRCDHLYYIGDMLHRKVRDLNTAADTVVLLAFKITALRAKKDMLKNKLRVAMEKEVEQRRKEDVAEEEWEEREEREREGKEGKAEGNEGKEGKEEDEGKEQKEEKEEGSENQNNTADEGKQENKEEEMSIVSVTTPIAIVTATKTITTAEMMMEDEAKENKMTVDEKVLIKRSILSITSLLSDKIKRKQRLQKLERPVCFSCPKCGWLPWWSKSSSLSQLGVVEKSHHPLGAR